MANTAIGQLPIANAVDGSEYMLVLQGGVDKRVSVQKAANTFTNNIPGAIEYIIDGTNSTIPPGFKGYLTVPFNCTITSAVLLADRAGSTSMDVWKCSYAQFDSGATHPVIGDTIVGNTTPIVISAAQKFSAVDLAGWSTGLKAGDVLAFVVGTTSIIQRLTLTLNVSRSLT